MNTPLRSDDLPARSDSTRTTPVSRTQVLRSRPARAPSSLMRKYEVQSLNGEGHAVSSHHIAPATPLFEDAASAFARGTLITTDTGPMAIEDLLPGDRIQTLDDGPQKVIWIASTMLVPSAPGQSDRMKRLTRVMTDSLGLARPMCDLVLGPGARMLRDKSAYGALTGSNKLLMPVTDFIDGMGIIELTPPTPVRVYHLALEQHSVIRVGGIDMESYHPGRHATEGLGQNMLSLYLSLFPHIHDVADFGPLAFPQADMALLEQMSQA
ncbi:Hint domain-containing protein [Mesobacterium pallidum]|uniref:Hint domain-containing protein n=1 Tax=Mesobacterium pallidum TaxID=2872037 RepID=UPI001EE28D74|nr:Hint domain-containing protein [Mesobacterium pallidum]